MTATIDAQSRTERYLSPRLYAPKPAGRGATRSLLRDPPWEWTFLDVRTQRRQKGHDLGQRYPLLQICVRALRECLALHLVSAEPGEDHDLGLCVGCADLRDGLQSVKPRHGQVEDHDVGPQRTYQRHR